MQGRRMASTRHATHWIDGEWVDGDPRLDSFDPATGSVIGTYADGGEREALAAIAAAHRAFHGSDWRDDRRLRSRALNEIADLFEQRTDDLVEILALENGKVKREARFEVEMVAPKLRFYA